jgi:NAD(P)-dependent dehydrogenase (short-subunit alcohol dehydrogenase family)
MSREHAPRWTAADIPDQSGRTIVITGASSGLGLATATLLAPSGAELVLACRDLGRGQAAAERIRTLTPAARISMLRVDLASLDSVRDAAAELHTRFQHVDVLINNAGAVFRQRDVTVDGHERTFATNHLGPFAFTGLVLDLLLRRPGSRVVTVSSLGHRQAASVNRDDPQHERDFTMLAAYAESKLANLLFAFELHRRLTDAEAPTISVAAHPGNAYSSLSRDMAAPVRMLLSPKLRPLTWWLQQPTEIGALGTVRAAVDPDARGGDFYGPPKGRQFTGYPARITAAPQAHDEDAQRWLWRESERLTGVTYPVPVTRG